MTEPLVGSMPPEAPPEPEPVVFPLSWLLSNASESIQYRAIYDVAKLEIPPRDLEKLTYTSLTALKLGVTQSLSGSWNDLMLAAPKPGSIAGVGTIHAVRRLLECGWDHDSPPLHRARRLLFRLLALDEDASLAFELAPKRGGSREDVARARGLLREASAAVLAQAALNKDPRVRGAATRITTRVSDFLRSPLAESPLIRVGNQHVLSPEASPPSIWMLQLLAYMPLFRTEHFDLMDRLGTYLAAPAPRTAPTIAVDREIVPMPHLVLGDPLPTIQAALADLPWALAWLELVARLGFLQKNENWSGIFDKLLAQRDGDGVWRSRKGAAIAPSEHPFTWATFPLEDDPSGERQWTDITFRLGLIARLAGRPIELI